MENGRTERQIEFIADTLAELAVNDQKHDQRLSRLERGLSRLERVTKLMIKTGLRERKTRNEADERLTAALTDLDRLERVLKKIVAAPREKSRFDRQRVESEKAYEQRRAEIREIGARSDAKLKALIQELQIAKDKPPQSSHQS